MAQLNNSLAYGFAKNVVCPIMMNAYKAANSNAKVSLTESTSDKFKPINFTINEGRSSKKVSVMAYNGNGVIALSMYNMMYAKNIGFIHENVCYLVDGDVLRANWAALTKKNRMYTDGCGISSEMTYADINTIISYAFTNFPINEKQVAKLEQKKVEYKM